MDSCPRRSTAAQWSHGPTCTSRSARIRFQTRWTWRLARRAWRARIAMSPTSHRGLCILLSSRSAAQYPNPSLLGHFSKFPMPGKPVMRAFMMPSSYIISLDQRSSAEDHKGPSVRRSVRRGAVSRSEAEEAQVTPPTRGDHAFRPFIVPRALAGPAGPARNMPR